MILKVVFIITVCLYSKDSLKRFVMRENYSRKQVNVVKKKIDSYFCVAGVLDKAVEDTEMWHELFYTL